MLSAAKVTEIYCMTDDFAGNLYLHRKKYMVGNKILQYVQIVCKYPIKYTLYS